MPKKIKVEAHLGVEELEKRYLNCKDAVEKTHWQIIWLIAKGSTSEEVSEVVGLSLTWIREIVHRYNTRKEAGLRDYRRENEGEEPMLNEEQQERLRIALRGKAPDGGLWSGPKVAAWISKETGRQVKRNLGWRYMIKLGFRPRRPRRHHAKANKEEQTEFKEVRLPARMKELQDAHPNERVEVWAQDEHRLGLQPIIRTVWVEKGIEPVVQVKPGYQWFYLYAFVHPATGRNYWWILPTVNVELFELALKEFAQEFEAGKGIQIILVLDKAGWHMSKQVQVPDGLHLEFLPPYSPELQPVERMWALSDETLANQPWIDIELMKDQAWNRCHYLMNHETQAISQRTLYHWWPDKPPSEGLIYA